MSDLLQWDGFQKWFQIFIGETGARDHSDTVYPLIPRQFSRSHRDPVLHRENPCIVFRLPYCQQVDSVVDYNAFMGNTLYPLLQTISWMQTTHVQTSTTCQSYPHTQKVKNTWKQHYKQSDTILVMVQYLNYLNTTHTTIFQAMMPSQRTALVLLVTVSDKAQNEENLAQAIRQEYFKFLSKILVFHIGIV